MVTGLDILDLLWGPKAKLDFALKFPARMAAWSCLTQRAMEGSDLVHFLGDANKKEINRERENMNEQNMTKLCIICICI
jgi:hypothetical protein